MAEGFVLEEVMAINFWMRKLAWESVIREAEQLPRWVQAGLMESHRLPGEARCQDCYALASYSRRNNGRLEYFCSIHATEDAGCFVLEEYRSKFK
jgi:hypothetical protein